MKKGLLIILMIAYSLSSLGLGVKRFYCCGRLKSTDISLIYGTLAKCAMGNEKDGCCKTTVETYKVSDSHLAADHIDVPLKYFAIVPSLPTFATNAQAGIFLYKASPAHAPPTGRIIPIHILTCVFRI